MRLEVPMTVRGEPETPSLLPLVPTPEQRLQQEGKSSKPKKEKQVEEFDSRDTLNWRYHAATHR